MAGWKKKLRYPSESPWFLEYYIGWIVIGNRHHETSIKQDLVQVEKNCYWICCLCPCNGPEPISLPINDLPLWHTGFSVSHGLDIHHQIRYYEPCTDQQLLCRNNCRLRSKIYACFDELTIILFTFKQSMTPFLYLKWIIIAIMTELAMENLRSSSAWWNPSAIS